MNKLLSSVGLAITFATVSLLAGCQLYFGDHANNNSGPSGGSNGGPAGYQCNGDAQCAAGCFCASGVCTEGGFCGTNKDCGAGFHCDTTRSSCIPDPQCSADAPCPQGSVCDPATNACVVTCTCTSDAEAVRQGFAWCDETVKTCMTGTDPAGTCVGTIATTCTTAQPACPDGQVALRKDGCFTGACRAITACEAAPACSALTHQDDCAGRTADCASVFTGHSCHGTTCGVSNVDCTCDSYTFSACEAKTATGTATRIIVGD